MKMKFPWLLLLAVTGVALYFKDKIFELLRSNGAEKVADFLTPKN